MKRRIAPRAARQRHRLAEFAFAPGVLGQSGIPGEDLAGVPRSESVIQQEVHHVILGEQLRDGRQFIRADLVAGGVDLALLLRLPELVDSAERIGRREHLRRDAFHQPFELQAGVPVQTGLRTLDDQA